MVVTMTSPGDTSIEYGGYGNSYGNNGDSYGNYDIYIDYDSFGYDDGNQRELRQWLRLAKPFVVTVIVKYLIFVFDA